MTKRRYILPQANPPNPRKSVKSVFNKSFVKPRIKGTCRFFVGDGFIRPEVHTFVNSRRATSIKAERGNLGTDKSVPYNHPATNARSENPRSNILTK
ncbi:MAG: hypothetical protein FWG87_06615 [Defluviitaleaceae bacterium]|nr:hypothetical protein [Defluviitaleaceae bacterium]